MSHPSDRYHLSRQAQMHYQTLVPGGAHTYSKAADQFPYLAPGMIARGQGAHVWDLDGNEYIDWSMGLTSVSLGHAYEPVLAAVRVELEKGLNFQRPSQTEYEAAQFILNHFGGKFDMVKFAKNGSTVTTAAIKLARGYTGKSHVVYCRSHPFFSYDDWFIGTTACDKGIPSAGKSLALGFDYNDTDGLKQIFAEHGDDIACVILEPMNGIEPTPNFFPVIQDLCQRYGALFILDEMITGFKWNIRGAQAVYDITPDLATWGKGMANGFSACALTGRREIMQQGGIEAGRERLFLISTTHGAETVSLAAMMATISEMENNGIIPDNHRRAAVLKYELEALIAAHGLNDYIQLRNHIAMLHTHTCNRAGNIDLGMKTLLMQELIARGLLWQGIFYTTWSHGEAEIEQTLQAFAGALPVYRQALEDGWEKHLVGNPVKPVFRKVN